MRERPLIDSPEAVEDYLRRLIGTRPYEVFVCLFMDARHRLIRSEESSRGSINRIAVYPREIVRRALTLNAASLIVAHNHRSGAVKPSASDRRLTRVLRDTLAADRCAVDRSSRYRGARDLLVRPHGMGVTAFLDTAQTPSHNGCGRVSGRVVSRK